MSRWFVSLPETTYIFPDVLAWPARRTTSGQNGRRDNKFFSHSSYIRAEILGSPRQGEVTKHTGDTEETEERRTVVRLDPIGEPVLVVTHERFSHRRRTGWRDVFQLVLLCTRPADTVSAYIILLYISRPGDAAPAIASAMKTSGDNSKEIRAAPRYITFGVPAVRRPPCSYPPSSSSLDPFDPCPSPAPPSNLPCLFGPRKSPTVIAFASSLLGSYPMAISRGWCFRNNNARGSQTDALRLFVYPLDLIPSSHFWR